MNRLAPLISRRAPFTPARPFREWSAPAPAATSKFQEDVKLFLTGWLAGLVFFGTFLG
jgi:hypothetical protein